MPQRRTDLSAVYDWTWKCTNTRRKQYQGFSESCSGGTINAPRYYETLKERFKIKGGASWQRESTWWRQFQTSCSQCHELTIRVIWLGRETPPAFFGMVPFIFHMFASLKVHMRGIDFQWVKKWRVNWRNERRSWRETWREVLKWLATISENNLYMPTFNHIFFQKIFCRYTNWVHLLFGRPSYMCISSALFLGLE